MHESDVLSGAGCTERERRATERGYCENDRYRTNRDTRPPTLRAIPTWPRTRGSSLLHESTGPGIAELAQTPYLQELEHAGRSAHTLRAYRTEVRRLAAFHSDDIAQLGVEQLRAFLATHIALSAASRARTQAALASFLACVMPTRLAG